MDVRTILRIVELIICVVLLILWYALYAYGTTVMLICGTVFGFTIITAVLVALEFLEFNSTLVYLIVGAILFLVCGCLTVVFLPVHGDGRLSHLVATSFFFANGIIFIIDFILEIKQ